IASATVTEAQFPPRTVRDLIEICAPASEDPKMTAAINYCHGFAQGAVAVEEAHGDHRDVRKLFCLPSPRPASGSEITKFISWANALRPGSTSPRSTVCSSTWRKHTPVCKRPLGSGERDEEAHSSWCSGGAASGRVCLARAAVQ